MAENTIFDSVFRTMVEKSPDLVIPLINEVFGRNYSDDEPIEQYRNEHQTVSGGVATDSFLKVCGRYYHVECQSTTDATMAIRMIEYDFAIAFEDALHRGAPYRMRLPEPCVLYLRGTSVPDGHLQMELEMADGTVVPYRVRALFAQAYGFEEIFAKRLLLLLPFYIMRYEGQFPEIAASEKRTSRLITECETLRARLENVTITQNKALIYEEIVELAVRISDYLLERQDDLRKRVRASMGGEVLELMCDRIAAAEEEARKKGLEEGRAEGREETLDQVAQRMREAGFDDDAIRIALGK